VESLRRCQIPWSVNALAQRVGVLLFTDPTIPSWLKETLSFLRKEKEDLCKKISDLGFRIVTGKVPFFLVRVGNSPHIREFLLRSHRILVRDCTSFGLPEWIRVMPNREEENSRLVLALREVKENFDVYKI
jgi:histidinol-phosphate aminotransferase